jgi:thiol-disulfide isomerase/thioredoxin
VWLSRYVDFRRLAVALPLLVAVALALYAFVPRTDTSTTPRAVLAETPPGADPEVRAGVQKGRLARDFVALSPDGDEVRLSDLRGTPVVVNFWATWCASCLAEMPDIHDVQREVGTENLHVVVVNVGESSDTAREFLDWLDAPAFRPGMDPTLVVADSYGVFGLPLTVFIDADGVIRATYAGHMSKDLIREFVAAAIGGSDADDPEPRPRLVTTVARDHVLVVAQADAGVEFRSKRLRCDETYCPSDVVDALRAHDGVLRVDEWRSDDPPRVSVRLDAGVASDSVVELVERLLRESEDPLYQRELEVVRE